MCLFFLLASVALLLYPAKRETMFLRRLRYIPHMFLFRMVAFESLFVSVAVGSLLSFLHKLAGSPLLCFWFTFIVPPQVGRPLPVHFYRSSTSGQASVYVFLFLGPLSLEFV